jgi:fructose-1,6-bisphosphatase/inositol monophosphatase family enzyme
MRLTRRNLSDLDAILREAGLREVMPRFRRLDEGDIRRKTSATDLVTEADEAAERAISAGLAKAFPGGLVIGEEAVSADPALLDAMHGADLAITVDPIDGTLNYASGAPLFCVMAAVVVKGVTQAAVIHDPVSGASHLALKGEGAWCEEADGRTWALRAAAPKPLAGMSGMVSWRYFPEPARSEITARYPAVADVASMKCCGHEYRLAAGGFCDFLIYGRLMPWDHAPGLLIHAEAGGFSALADGSPYRPAAGGAGVIAAPDRDSWEALRAAFYDAQDGL